MADWKHHGVRVVHADELDANTPQTAAMLRQAAIDPTRAGAQKLRAGTTLVDQAAKTGAHHHGVLGSVSHAVGGRGKMIRG